MSNGATQSSSCRRRVLLKISGEALQGGMGFGVDPQVSHNRCLAEHELKHAVVTMLQGMTMLLTLAISRCRFYALLLVKLQL